MLKEIILLMQIKNKIGEIGALRVNPSFKYATFPVMSSFFACRKAGDMPVKPFSSVSVKSFDRMSLHTLSYALDISNVEILLRTDFTSKFTSNNVVVDERFFLEYLLSVRHC